MATYMHGGVRDYKMSKDYYSFAFVRNPWDRMVSIYEFTRARYLENKSRYKHMKGYKYLEKPFAEWLLNCETWDDDFKSDSIPPLQRRSQSYYITEDGKDIAVNFVGMFEELDRDVKMLGKILDINVPTIPKLNATEHPRYQSYYTQATKDFIAEHFKWEIDEFGYTY